MSTKFCKNCGKELPKEAVFCPYCMTKLIDVKTGAEVKVKKKKYIVFLVIALLVIIVAACVFFAVRGLSDTDNDKPESKKQDKKPVATKESTESEAEDTVDYSSYIGIWCDEGTNADSIALEGGRMVEIISVDDDFVRFTYTKISSAPGNRIAIISNVNTQIVDGVGTFTFDNDGWNNSGTGKIKFLENEIYLETNITSKNESANWHIGGHVYLKKDDDTIFDLKNSETGLGKDFYEVRSMYGEEIKEKIDVTDVVELHYYDGFSVYVDTETNTVFGIDVFYNQPGFAKTSPCYGEINGNSNYDDVYRVHSEPNVNRLSDGYVVYNVNDMILIYNFDDNRNVISISLCQNKY